MDPLAQQIANEIDAYNKSGQPSRLTRHVHALAQRNYDALNARGYWRRPENQAMANALRAHGFVQDSTQGGLLPQGQFSVTPQIAPISNGLFDGTSPQADAIHRINDFATDLNGGEEPGWKASTNRSYADLMGINSPTGNTLPASRNVSAAPTVQARSQFAQARPKAATPGVALAASAPPRTQMGQAAPLGTKYLRGIDGKMYPATEMPGGVLKFYSTDGRDPFAFPGTPIADDERIHGGLGNRAAFRDMTVATLRGTSQTAFYGNASEGGRRLTEDDPRVKAYVRAHPGTKVLPTKPGLTAIQPTVNRSPATPANMIGRFRQGPGQIRQPTVPFSKDYENLVKATAPTVIAAGKSLHEAIAGKPGQMRADIAANPVSEYAMKLMGVPGAAVGNVLEGAISRIAMEHHLDDPKFKNYTDAQLLDELRRFAPRAHPSDWRMALHSHRQPWDMRGGSFNRVGPEIIEGAKNAIAGRPNRGMFDVAMGNRGNVTLADGTVVNPVLIMVP